MTAKRFSLEWYAQKYQELSEENEQLRKEIEEKEEVIKFYHRFNRGVDDDL